MMLLEDELKGVLIASPKIGCQFFRAVHPSSGMCF
jgi:hypothetical protein